MKILKKSLLLIFYFILISGRVYSQPKNFILLEQDYVPILDSMTAPPSNCEEAAKLMVFDSLKQEFVFTDILETQNEGIQNLYDELTNSIKKDRSGKNMPPRKPDRSGPLGNGIPPGVPGDIGDQLPIFIDDLANANDYIDKLNVTREKLKDDFSILLTNANNKLHKTLESDSDAHIKIINELLKSGSDMYKTNYRFFRENMMKIDGIIKKYDYGTKLRMQAAKSEITQLQIAQVTNLKFLMKVTLEFASIGTKFYRKDS